MYQANGSRLGEWDRKGRIHTLCPVRLKFTLPSDHGNLSHQNWSKKGSAGCEADLYVTR